MRHIKKYFLILCLSLFHVAYGGTVTITIKNQANPEEYVVIDINTFDFESNPPKPFEQEVPEGLFQLFQILMGNQDLADQLIYNTQKSYDSIVKGTELEPFTMTEQEARESMQAALELANTLRVRDSFSLVDYSLADVEARNNVVDDLVRTIGNTQGYSDYMQTFAGRTEPFPKIQGDLIPDDPSQILLADSLVQAEFISKYSQRYPEDTVVLDAYVRSESFIEYVQDQVHQVDTLALVLSLPEIVQISLFDAYQEKYSTDLKQTMKSELTNGIDRLSLTTRRSTLRSLYKFTPPREFQDIVIGNQYFINALTDVESADIELVREVLKSLDIGSLDPPAQTSLLKTEGMLKLINRYIKLMQDRNPDGTDEFNDFMFELLGKLNPGVKSAVSREFRAKTGERINLELGEIKVFNTIGDARPVYISRDVANRSDLIAGQLKKTHGEEVVWIEGDITRVDQILGALEVDYYSSVEPAIRTTLIMEIPTLELTNKQLFSDYLKEIGTRVGHRIFDIGLWTIRLKGTFDAFSPASLQSPSSGADIAKKAIITWTLTALAERFKRWMWPERFANTSAKEILEIADAVQFNSEARNALRGAARNYANKFRGGLDQLKTLSDQGELRVTALDANGRVKSGYFEFKSYKSTLSGQQTDIPAFSQSTMQEIGRAYYELATAAGKSHKTSLLDLGELIDYGLSIGEVVIRQLPSAEGETTQLQDRYKVTDAGVKTLDLNRLLISNMEGFDSLATHIQEYNSEFEMGSTKKLILKLNLITELKPDSLAGFESLEELDLSDNRLTVVDQTFVEQLPPTLTTLELSQNDISLFHPDVLEAMFEKLPNLEKISLGQNKLSPDSVSALEAKGVELAETLGRKIEVSVGEQGPVGLGERITRAFNNAWENFTQAWNRRFPERAAVARTAADAAEAAIDTVPSETEPLITNVTDALDSAAGNLDEGELGLARDDVSDAASSVSDDDFYSAAEDLPGLSDIANLADVAEVLDQNLEAMVRAESSAETLSRHQKEAATRQEELFQEIDGLKQYEGKKAQIEQYERDFKIEEQARILEQTAEQQRIEDEFWQNLEAANKEYADRRREQYDRFRQEEQVRAEEAAPKL